LAIGGCIRFSSDAPLDASIDALDDTSVSTDGTLDADAGSKADVADSSDGGSRLDTSLDGRDEAEAGDAPAEAAPLPICQRFDPSIRLSIAGDVVSALLTDCRIRSAFASLPPVRLQHFQECFAAQVASVLGCLHPDGTRFKYPAYDSNGQFCRDMKTAHASLTTSDGDFDAFLAAVSYGLGKNGLTDDEIVRALRSFGAGTTRSDIVKLRDAGPTNPTLPCDAGSGGSDARADGPRDGSVEASPDGAEAAVTDGGLDASTE
jgi:hypothetical protein